MGECLVLNIRSCEKKWLPYKNKNAIQQIKRLYFNHTDVQSVFEYGSLSTFCLNTVYRRKPLKHKKFYVVSVSQKQ